MNCELCREKLESYHEGRLSHGTGLEVKKHLESCSECASVYQAEIITERVVTAEKELQSNPFLSTRIMASIEQSESRSVPVWQKNLKPVLLMVSIAAAIMIGIFSGSIYKPYKTTERVPVELTYINDASFELVNYLSNN